MPHGNTFFKALIIALIIVAASYWLPFAFGWFVLEAPGWLVALLALVATYLAVDVQRRPIK